MRIFSLNLLATLITVVFMIFSSCRTVPEGATVYKPFDKSRYLGKWYEIARFDFRFERNLNNTTAEYSLNSDGSIKVVNRGFNYILKEWKEAVGKAKFTGDPTEAKLKVSFFGPFYAPYNVIALDDQYQYSLVAGKNLKYLWILSREKTIPDDIKQRYLKIANEIGYDTSKFIWVEHN